MKKKWEKRAPIRCSLWCFHAKLFCSSVAFCRASDLITAWCFQPLFWVISKKNFYLRFTAEPLKRLHNYECCTHSWESQHADLFCLKFSMLAPALELFQVWILHKKLFPFLISRVETATLAASDVQKRSWTFYGCQFHDESLIGVDGFHEISEWHDNGGMTMIYRVIFAESLCASREDGKKREADWRLNRIEPWIFSCSRLGIVIVLISRLFSFLHSEWAASIDWLGFLVAHLIQNKSERYVEEREATSSWGKTCLSRQFCGALTRYAYKNGIWRAFSFLTFVNDFAMKYS